MCCIKMYTKCLKNKATDDVLYKNVYKVFSNKEKFFKMQ